jgi:predicted GTPase
MDTKALSSTLQAAIVFLSNAELPTWPQREADLTILQEARERLERRFTLAVVGEFSSGKSYLLNALLGKIFRREGKIVGLLTVDINPSTATITELEFAEEETATARYPSGRTERIPIDQLSRFVAVAGGTPGALHDATTDDDHAPTHVLVRVNSPFLQHGFIIADTPGLASLNPAHRRATLGYLPRTDAVLYLIDTQQPFTEGDAAFLELIGEHVRAIFIVQTKIDLWRMTEDNEKQAWENARDRIAAHAARHAPNAEVFAVSSHDYALGHIDDNAVLRERSGFPALLRALDDSLEDLVRHARAARAIEAAENVLSRASARLQREQTLLTSDSTAVREQREDAASSLARREGALAAERDAIAAAGIKRAEGITAHAHGLREELLRALASAFDIADIERIRDRGKLHMLADGIFARIFGAFADEAASDIAAELRRIGHERPMLHILERTALCLGGEPGTGAWSRDLASGIRSTILLDAIGGPTVNFVHVVASAFAAREQGAYMKRELKLDLRERFFPQLEADVTAFTNQLAERIASVYQDLAAATETERSTVRAQALDPIERALSLANDDAARGHAAERAAHAYAGSETLRASLAACTLTTQSEVRPSVRVKSLTHDVSFDADVYQNGLNPQRLRIVVLGALRRGKSSLINAIAGTRLLRDEGGVEAAFPIHVRYGPEEQAYALIREGKWHEIPLAAAMKQATETPVLLEVPWKMPRELVLVHAPAFDSGSPHAEEISLTAATAASGVIALFSRQLSDGELTLYKRVAELGKPMYFAHTIADNESVADRRTVVELAARYLRERDIPSIRIFTLSALDYYNASLAGHAPSAWNELGALRATLTAQAEEHMQRLARLPLQPSEQATPPPPETEENPASPLRRILLRMFKRR